MGAEFLMLEFEEDGSGEGGYAKPASPEFIEKEMALFREQAPEIDIVITTALIPGRPAPKLWPAEMVGLMKPGSVVVDLAAEQGGNRDLTVADQIVTSDNGVKIVGYTDFPSRMAAQSSTLYATNIRHMLDDLTPEKDGQITINMEDDVIRGATVVHAGEIAFPPPAPKVQAIGKAPAAPKLVELTPKRRRRWRPTGRQASASSACWSLAGCSCCWSGPMRWQASCSISSSSHWPVSSASR